jgi:hypothetical protein
MTPKSPMLVALKGDQHKLKKEHRQAILDSPAKKYASDAQRKAVHASKADGGKGAPAKKKCKKCGSPMCMCGPKHRK